MTTDGRKDSLPEPELDEYGIPVRERPPRRWASWALQIACLAGGIAAFYVAVVAETGAHGVRWHTHHFGPELPGWGTIGLTVFAAYWKKRQDDTSKPGWYILGLALALGIIAIWVLSLTQPYSDSGGAYVPVTYRWNSSPRQPGVALGVSSTEIIPDGTSSPLRLRKWALPLSMAGHWNQVRAAPMFLTIR